MRPDLWKDHPRLRGEKKGEIKNGKEMVGSPPLTRGKGKLGFFTMARRRITPAYAGKRDVKFSFVPRFKDHPRLRGEKIG